MKLVIFVAAITMSLPSFATLTVANLDCPTQFEGTVKEIIEPLGPDTGLSTHKVIFENQHTIKGDVAEKVQLDILKNGPFAVEKGNDYRVQLRNGKLCWIEQL
jgi:hypothetical protein